MIDSNDYVKKDGLYVDEKMGDFFPDIYVSPMVDEDSSICTAYTGFFEDFNVTLLHRVGKLGEEVNPYQGLYEIIDTDLNTKKRRYFKVVFDHEEDISDLELAINDEEEHAQA